MKNYIFRLKSIIFIKIITDSLYIIAIASIPYIIKSLIDYDFSKGSKGVLIIILLYLLAAVAGMGFQYISQLYSWKLTRKFNLLIKEDIFNSILNYSYTKFKDSKLSTYVSILNNDVNVMEEYVQSITAIIQSIIQVIIYGIYIFILNPIIALVIILCSSFTLFLPNLTTKTLSRRRSDHLNTVSLYIGKITDLLEGFKNVNNNTRKHISEEHNKILFKTENKLLHYGKFKTFVTVFNGLCMYLLDLSAFIVAAILLLKGKITVGTAVATLAYIKEFVYPIRYLIADLTNIKSTKAIKENLLHFMEQEDKNELPSANNFNSFIEFSDVSVKFDNFELAHFNYIFKKGKKYAIIGHSGSGKSTIINLLMKYLEKKSGKITIDGTDIKEIDITSLICCVNQFEHIFSDDFINNVTVYDAYPSTNLNNILNYLECNKINSMKTNKNCTELSGGEKQLLSLIKMMLINRDIIVLDEPFSALDIQNRLLMQDKVYGLQDKTLIAVTHDISESNLSYFDEIIIMDNGCILKSGHASEILNESDYNDLIRYAKV